MPATVSGVASAVDHLYLGYGLPRYGNRRRSEVLLTQCWWLYLLVCRDGRTYAGIATDVAGRFAAHSRGKGAKFTRSNPPVRVLAAQVFASKSEALKAEAALKKLDRTKRLAWARKCAALSNGILDRTAADVRAEEG